MRHLASGVAVLLLLPALSRAEPEDLGPVLEPLRRRHNLPALAGGIVQGDELVAVGATGRRRRGSFQKVTANDLWHIGSCTKTMTATLLARLVESGELRWDTPVREVFRGPDVHPGFRGVTLEQLLAHQGGAPRSVTQKPIWRWLWASRDSTAAERVTFVNSLLGERPETTAGSAFVYSSAGYVIAAAMAERLTGRPWEQLMEKQVFEPLGMDEAGFGPPGTLGPLDQPRGHTAAGRTMEPGERADHPPAFAPAGGVHVSLRSWARFLAAHVTRGGSAEGFLRPATLEKLQTPVVAGEPYALGWLVVERKWEGGRVLTLSGSNNMWYASTWVAPQNGFAVFVVTNQGGDAAARATDAASWALIQRHIDSD